MCCGGSVVLWFVVVVFGCVVGVGGYVLNCKIDWFDGMFVVC